ncbi:hypothetical protein D7Y27_31805 [Corallococcus sp. AB004]|uniref:hypothetical protein n=1 Tax=Corallococcus TaxID=83461 RepID=UPI000EA00202|nr:MULTISPECIES: hypothetical protein [Corallococcus]NPC72671.1 hypothetical protein [Corallococcus exiguus]NRD49046.1 hypothetical protein [Corallococcus exiguus]RKH95248.1 hypothetical protein D7Y04_33610 [Corallococcus sp. AB038B]RKI35414.1 hypothetical protein D7Y27_31805 [Corallococcus sp. AB004]
MQPQPFEEEFSSQGDEMSDLLAEGEEGFEDEGMDDPFEGEGMEEGFEAEGFEDNPTTMEDPFEGEGFEDNPTTMEEGFEAEGFEENPTPMEEGFEAEGFETDNPNALEDTFADAMDAQDEDEFLRRLAAGARRLATVAGPTFQRIRRRAMPIAMRLIRQAAPRLGGIAGQEIGRSLGGLLRADAMDAFADAAGDYANDEDMDAFNRVLGGLAARHVVRSTMSPARRRQSPQQARALGRAVGQMTTQLASRISQRYGPRALPAVTRVVRQVTRLVRQQGASPQAVPRMLRRIGGRVISSPRVVRRLARTSAAVRQLRARAGLRRTGPRGRVNPMMGGTGLRRLRTVTLRGPVRVIVR